MTLGKLCGASIVLGLMTAGIASAQAEDEAATTSSSTAPNDMPLRDRGPRVRPSRWESGLDIRYTQVVNTSTPMLGAQWLRKFSTETRVGGSLAALPTSVKKKEDSVTTRANLLEGGLVVEQPVWISGVMRLSLSLGVGAGRLWVRAEPEGLPSVVETMGFNYVEPNVHFLFYNAKHLDMGVMAGVRVARINGDSDDVESADVGGAQFGVTFRHQI